MSDPINPLKDFLHVLVDAVDDKRVQNKKELHKEINDQGFVQPQKESQKTVEIQ
jgi:hypothetical protein